MVKNYWAGIGATNTPLDIQKKMSNLAFDLYLLGWHLRSGGAEGADKAFEKYFDKNKTIFRPKDATPESIELTKKYHPAWDKVVAKKVENYHGRNAMIILGEKLNDPVKFVICWTEDGKASGGTGQGMRIAMDKKIPIFNLYFPDAVDELKEFLNPTNHVDLS